jgi:hypothetical protein
MAPKIFTERTFFANSATAAQLRERVHALEGAGAAGISMWDHIFGGDRRTHQPCDPLTSLAAITAMSGHGLRGHHRQPLVRGHARPGDGDSHRAVSDCWSCPGCWHSPCTPAWWCSS